jgi:CheY-like chemotaxis protein
VNPNGASSQRALILAPNGRDAPLIVMLLKDAGFAADICPHLGKLNEELHKGAGLAIIADEALQSPELRPLVAFLRAQPAWSDIPIILLTHRGGGPEWNPAALRLAAILGNVSFLERPFHPISLTTMVRAATRGRRRQYDARGRSDEISQRERQLHTALTDLAFERTALSNLTRTLEQCVVERTGELMAEVAAREKAQEQLLQAQKMESVGQLTGGIAHGFNNLLTAVMGNLEILRKRLPDDPGTRRLIDGAQQGAQRGASLTQRMLAFARQQGLRTTSVDLGTLPQAARPAGGTEAAAGPASFTRTATILVVDDDPLIATSTIDMLEDLGHTVIGVNSGAQALEIINGGECLDLLMTDQVMPGMTGIQLAEIVRRTRPDLPVLLATGYTDLPAGMLASLPRLSKPYRQAQLQAEIEKLLSLA